MTTLTGPWGKHFVGTGRGVPACADPDGSVCRCPAAGGGVLWGCADIPPILRIGSPSAGALDGRLPPVLADVLQDDPTQLGPCIDHKSTHTRVCSSSTAEAQDGQPKRWARMDRRLAGCASAETARRGVCTDCYLSGWFLDGIGIGMAGPMPKTLRVSETLKVCAAGRLYGVGGGSAGDGNQDAAGRGPLATRNPWS